MASASVIEPPDLWFEKLSSNLAPGTFDCTEDDGSDPHGLQVFIAREALKYHTERLGVTYLVYQETVPVAFLTVSMSSLRIIELDSMEKVEKVMVPYPALLLGRLAVEKNWRGREIGTFLCQWVIGLARNLSTRVGCTYVVLHTLPDKAGFYTRNPLNFVVSSLERTDGRRLLYRRITD